MMRQALICCLCLWGTFSHANETKLIIACDNAVRVFALTYRWQQEGFRGLIQVLTNYQRNNECRVVKQSEIRSVLARHTPVRVPAPEPHTQMEMYRAEVLLNEGAKQLMSNFELP